MKKLRHIRQNYDYMNFVACGILFLCLLFVAYGYNRDLFNMLIAIGGMAGGLFICYEIYQTKQLAQAEFVRDLQTSFTSDEMVMSLWGKLLSGEGIDSKNDRLAISSYLTFFETLYVLHTIGILKISISDDLFRNRFFKAVGNEQLQQATIISEPENFSNIHSLVDQWRYFLLRSQKPIHRGYYSYAKAAVSAKANVSIRRLNLSDLQNLESLQARVLQDLKHDDWLRKNGTSLLAECLAEEGDSGHATFGAFEGDVLVAAAILYDGKDSEESIRGHLLTASKRASQKGVRQMKESINLKLVLTDLKTRRTGIGRCLIELCEEEAALRGKHEILCTIHKHNVPSRSLFKILGYRKLGSHRTSYGPRLIYGRKIPC